MSRLARRVARSKNNFFAQTRAFGGTWRTAGGLYGQPCDVSEPPYLDHDEEPDFPRKGKMVVFGGNGFVGSEVVRTLTQRGYDVISISRSGDRPAHTTENYTRFRAPDLIDYQWAQVVQWEKGDINNPDTYKHFLKTEKPDMPFMGVVCCVGGFSERSNSQCVKLVETCAEAKVPRFCYISGAHYPVVRQLLSGYFNGKMKVEDAVIKHFPETGVALRAPAVTGVRWIGGIVPFALWFPLLPLRIMSCIARWTIPRSIGMDKVFIKPIHSEHLASAASNFLERPTVRFKGIVDEYDDLRRLGRSFTDYYFMEPKQQLTR